MKIVSIVFVGEKLAILDNREGIPFSKIDGTIVIGASLVKVGKRYVISQSISEVCEA